MKTGVQLAQENFSKSIRAARPRTGNYQNMFRFGGDWRKLQAQARIDLKNKNTWLKRNTL